MTGRYKYGQFFYTICSIVPPPLYLISYICNRIYVFPLSSILISTFFSFTSRLYKRIRDAEMCQLQIFSSPVEKSRCSLRLCVFPHGRTPPLDCLSPPVLWRWLSPTSPYRYSFYRRRRCVCGVLGFYIYKFLIQRNKEEMGNSRLASKCFRSHFLRTWLFRLLHTFHPPPQNYI